MTSGELRNIFNEFELGKWPKTYEVDHETYANVCQEVFNSHFLNEVEYYKGRSIRISLGSNNGIMFKDIELILKGSK